MCLFQLLSCEPIHSSGYKTAYRIINIPRGSTNWRSAVSRRGRQIHFHFVRPKMLLRRQPVPFVMSVCLACPPSAALCIVTKRCKIGLRLCVYGSRTGMWGRLLYQAHKQRVVVKLGLKSML